MATTLNQTKWIWLGGGLIFAMLLSPAPSQEKEKPPAVGTQDADDDDEPVIPTRTDETALELANADRSFDRFFGPAQFAKASVEQDSTFLTDVVLQLMEGERVLRRPHKAINSKELALRVARLAASKRDVESLRRLADVGTQTGFKELADTVQSLMPLAKAKRAASAPLMLDSPTKQESQIAQTVMDELQEARITGSKKDAAEVAGFVEAALVDKAISIKNAKLILNRIEAEKKNLSDEDASLGKLLAPSRDWGDGTKAGPKYASTRDRTYYKAGSQKLQFFAGFVEGDFNFTNLDAKARKMISDNSGKTHLFDNKYYSVKLSPTESVYWMVVGYNATTGKRRWAAMRLLKTWTIRDDSNSGLTNLPNNQAVDFNWSKLANNSLTVIARIKNPPNNSNFSGSHVLYKFATE